MELIIIITSLCIITLSVLLKPSHSLQLIQVQSSHDRLAHDHDHQLTLPALPRKLKLTEEASMRGYEGQDMVMVSYNTKKNHALSAGHKEAKMIHSNGGTWREWMEGTDTSQFFTMDYSHVRRRRPIHNKSLPVAP